MGKTYRQTGVIQLLPSGNCWPDDTYSLDLGKCQTDGGDTAPTLMELPV